MTSHRTLGARIKAAAAGAALAAAVAAQALPAHATGISGPHGCVATAADSCTFVGYAAGIPNGVASATSGSWAITHDDGDATVTDVAGSGPNLFPFLFSDGVLYTLTVGTDGAGAVAAGSPT